MPYVLAVDQGTSSSRALVFDTSGAVVGVGQRGFDSTFPADGWVEQDPEVIWRTTVDAVHDALAASGVAAGSIAAMGIANQRETTVVWDAETGQAIHTAIVWQDRRTADRCSGMVDEGVEAGIREVTGLVVDPYFSSTKLAWLLERDGVRAAARAGRLCFGTIDSFLIWRFTGGQRHCTDATNASRTQLYDIAHHAWSDTLLDYFDIPVALLPEVKDCVDDFGVCDASHFGAAIPIRGVAGD
ncbi:MAG: FGGY family carbohydrate kinase, partial [Gammaproteobacteria bacterium]|nr:FGGY family carbohydrate kinase [Gammaproteobacteria bacterium]